MDLSTDHKPNLLDERLRIENAQGHVTRERGLRFAGGRVQWDCHRVNRNLAMSRSIGDFHYKNLDLAATEQMVTCSPDVLTVDITHDTEFLLIASDGIWDMLSSQGAVDFVSKKLAKGTTDLRSICEDLLTHCVQSGDNLTVILVWFKHAGRLPRPPPASVPAVDPTGAGTSSVANPDASVEAKADTGSEIKEAEAPLPVSTMPTEL